MQLLCNCLQLMLAVHPFFLKATRAVEKSKTCGRYVHNCAQEGRVYLIFIYKLWQNPIRVHLVAIQLAFFSEESLSATDSLAFQNAYTRKDVCCTRRQSSLAPCDVVFSSDTPNLAYLRRSRHCDIQRIQRERSSTPSSMEQVVRIRLWRVCIALRARLLRTRRC